MTCICGPFGFSMYRCISTKFKGQSCGNFLTLCSIRAMGLLPTGGAHCTNVWVTSTMFWSSQLHACCVCDTLQTSKGIFLFESKVEKLLPQWGSSYKKPAIAIWLHTWQFYHNAIRHSSRDRGVVTKKQQFKPHQKCL